MPAAHVDLVQVGWGEQVPAVLDGRVDAVFARPPLPEAPVRRTLVLTEPRVLAMSTAHRLTDLQELRSTDLAGTVQVDTENVDPVWRAWWSLDPRPDGRHPRYGPVVHSIEEMLQVVASTDVVAITAASVARIHPRPDIAYRAIVDIDPCTVELVTPLAAPNPLVALLIDIVGNSE